MPRKSKNEEFRAWVKEYKTYILQVPIKGISTCEFSVLAKDLNSAVTICVLTYPDAKRHEIRYINSYSNL